MTEQLSVKLDALARDALVNAAKTSAPAHPIADLEPADAVLAALR